MRSLMYFEDYTESKDETCEILKKMLPNWDVYWNYVNRYDSVYSKWEPVDPKSYKYRNKMGVCVGTGIGGLIAGMVPDVYHSVICINPYYDLEEFEKRLEIDCKDAHKKPSPQQYHEIKEWLKNIDNNKFKFEGKEFEIIGLFGTADYNERCEKEFLKSLGKNVSIQHFNGGHRMDEKTIAEVLVPLINKYRKDLKGPASDLEERMYEVKGYKYPLSFCMLGYGYNGILELNEYRHLSGKSMFKEAGEVAQCLNEYTGRKYRLPTIDELRYIMQIDLGKKLLETINGSPDIYSLIACWVDRYHDGFFDVKTNELIVQCNSPHGNPMVHGSYWFVETTMAINDVFVPDYVDEEFKRAQEEEAAAERERKWLEEDWYG